MGEKEGVFVSADILKSTGVSFEELKHQFIELKSILGNRFGYIVPQNISGVPELYQLIRLNQQLQKLKQFEGFERHIKTYTKKQFQSSYFVTAIASYLSDKVDNIVLEPPITGRTTKGDILIAFRGEQVYMECKHTSNLRFDYLEEHDHLFKILCKYINVPHQISVKYKKPLSDTELHRLGETLQQRVGLPTGDGIIINNPSLEVQIIKREAYADRRLRLIMSMIVEDLNDKCRYPGHAYTKDGITLTLSGPKVSYAKVLREKFKKSKDQAPHRCPYVLVIDGNMLLGEVTENIRSLSTAFQPELNTRFSAAIIVEYYPRWDSPDLNYNRDYNFQFVSNPFAKFPVSKEFSHLFSSS